MTTKHIKKFQTTIWNYYRKNKRNFPWRETSNPYRIFISEVMLQQTQARRAVEKYNKFIRVFPNFAALARAPFKKIFSVWRGLGYNRRALFLKRAAEIIVKKYHGVLPRSIKALTELPGIGYTTACSILAFAYNMPVAFIETNIRSVFLHSFFPRKKSVHDREILPLVEKTVDHGKPREWYYALMDYGAMLKKRQINPSRRSQHHIKQTPFKNSNRQIRGKILALLQRKKYRIAEIQKKTGAHAKRLKKILNDLRREELISKIKDKYVLA